MEKFERIEQVRKVIELIDYTPVTGEELEALKWRGEQARANSKISLAEKGLEPDPENEALFDMFIEMALPADVRNYACHLHTKLQYNLPDSYLEGKCIE